VEGRPRTDHRGLVEVGVLQDDQRIVATQLQRDLLEQPAAVAAIWRPTVVDPVKWIIAMSGWLTSAGDSTSRQDLEQPAGRRLGEQLGDSQAAADRGLGEA